MGQELEGESIVVRFTRCKSETDGQSIGINHHMNLTGQSASRPAHGLFLIASDTSGVLMNAHNGRVDHLHGRVVGACQCSQVDAADGALCRSIISADQNGG